MGINKERITKGICGYNWGYEWASTFVRILYGVTFNVNVNGEF